MAYKVLLLGFNGFIANVVVEMLFMITEYLDNLLYEYHITMLKSEMIM